MSILIINVVLAVIFQCCIVLPKTHAANTVKPKNCPPGTYYSGVSFITGLPACYACPNTLEDCKNEKIADVKTCQTSCANVYDSSSTTNPSFSKGTFPTTQLQTRTTKSKANSIHSSSTTSPSFSKGTFPTTWIRRKTTKGPFHNSTNQRSTETTPSIYLANNEEDKSLVVGLASGFSVLIFIIVVIFIYWYGSRKRGSKIVTTHELTSQTGNDGIIRDFPVPEQETTSPPILESMANRRLSDQFYEESSQENYN
ncbi:Hypothetical predicted protein [Paramuricea clavata]|uniref:Uncharacterized protein n=1 Tax=Paramuricea clavata TaxID=317549 RepID=A0A6S7I3L8_PARCT|nr:Hypothetical predicted protein [Paramuricea clavata]